MAQKKFDNIYNILKQEIYDGKYNETKLLPTEENLVKKFDSSRNTVRQAIKLLKDEGVVISVKGRGVIILEKSNLDQIALNFKSFDGIKSLSSSHPLSIKTKVIELKEIKVSEELSPLISFPINEDAFYLERIRVINNEALAYDISYFKKDIVGGLNESIAKESIYEYIKNSLNFKIMSKKAILKVESANKKDYNNLSLNESNCVGVIESNVYNDFGQIFEHTITRYVPNRYIIPLFEQIN